MVGSQGASITDPLHCMCQTYRKLPYSGQYCHPRHCLPLETLSIEIRWIWTGNLLDGKHVLCKGTMANLEQFSGPERLFCDAEGGNIRPVHLNCATFFSSPSLTFGDFVTVQGTGMKSPHRMLG